MKHRADTILRDPIPHHRRTLDDKPQIALFVKEEMLNFVWTGQWADPIEVEVGYSDAPIGFIIPCDPDTGLRLEAAWSREVETGYTDSPPALLAWFERLCRRWIARAHEGTYEGMAVEEVRGG